MQGDHSVFLQHNVEGILEEGYPADHVRNIQLLLGLVPATPQLLYHRPISLHLTQRHDVLHCLIINLFLMK
jgi:hypothetical protein